MSRETAGGIFYEQDRKLFKGAKNGYSCSAYRIAACNGAHTARITEARCALHFIPLHSDCNRCNRSRSYSRIDSRHTLWYHKLCTMLWYGRIRHGNAFNQLVLHLYNLCCCTSSYGLVHRTYRKRSGQGV